MKKLNNTVAGNTQIDLRIHLKMSFSQLPLIAFIYQDSYKIFFFSNYTLLKVLYPLNAYNIVHISMLQLHLQISHFAFHSNIPATENLMKSILLQKTNPILQLLVLSNSIL